MLLIIELIFARYGGRVGSKVLNRLFGMVKYRRGKVNIGGIAQAHTHGKVLKQTINRIWWSSRPAKPRADEMPPLRPAYIIFLF